MTIKPRQDVRRHKLEQLFASYYEKGQFNGNVLLADHGQPVYIGAFGCADRKTGRRLTEHSMFNTASVSKTFTSAAVLLLCQRGLLRLDQPIEPWFPELPYRGVTVRQLLGHTSGIPNYIRPVRTGQFGERWSRARLAGNTDLIEELARLQPQPDFAPDADNAYSNTAYLLLALLIERLADCPFGVFLDRHIFGPFGLQRTQENHDPDRAAYIADYAVGFMLNEEGRYVLPHELSGMEFCYYLDALQGDGNVHSTVHDLLRWDRVLCSGQLLPQTVLDEAYEPVMPASGTPGENGLGWFVSQHPSRGRCVGHSGYWPGYGAVFDRYIDADKTVIMLCNEEYDDCYKLREQMMEEAVELLFSEAAGQRSP